MKGKRKVRCGTLTKAKLEVSLGCNGRLEKEGKIGKTCHKKGTVGDPKCHSGKTLEKNKTRKK